jgi:hypothetical protein
VSPIPFSNPFVASLTTLSSLLSSNIRTIAQFVLCRLKEMTPSLFAAIEEELQQQLLQKRQQQTAAITVTVPTTTTDLPEETKRLCLYTKPETGVHQKQ